MKYVKSKSKGIIEIDENDWYWCDDIYDNRNLYQRNSPFDVIEENDIVAIADSKEELE